MSDKSLRFGGSVLAASFVLLLSSFSSSSAESAMKVAGQTWLVSQAGSTGGALGNDEKSASGAQRSSTPKSTPAAAPRRAGARPDASTPNRHVRAAAKSYTAARSEPLAPKEHPGAKAVSLTAYNGSWTGVSTGPCIPRWTWGFLIDSGIMRGDRSSNISGRVRQNGNAAGRMIVFGTTYNFIGHIGARDALGTWVKSGPHGCSGVWTATRL